MLTIGYPDPLFLFSFGDRERPSLPTDQRAVLWEAVQRSVERGRLAPAQVGVLVADEGRDVLAAANERGLVRVVPVGNADRGPFELAHGERFGRHLEDTDAQIARVGLSWNPGQPPEDKKSQAMHLAKLAAWLHETDRKLLIDLEVPAVESDLQLADGDDARFRAEQHPHLVWRSVQEIRDLGAEPDLWITEPPRSGEDASALAELVREAGRDDVAILAPDTDPEPLVGTATRPTGYRGFVAGRSIWAEALAAFDTASASRDEAAETIVTAFLRRLERFRTATDG